MQHREQNGAFLANVYRICSLLFRVSDIDPDRERTAMALTVAKSALEAIREKGLGGFLRMIREEGFLLVFLISRPLRFDFVRSLIT